MQKRKVVDGIKGIGVVLAQYSLAGLEGTQIERFGLAIATLPSIQASKVVGSSECIGVILVQHPFLSLEGTHIQRLSLIVAALVLK